MLSGVDVAEGGGIEPGLADMIRKSRAALLVEPNDEYAALIDGLLRRVGCRAEREVDGGAALRQAEQTNYALALVDVDIVLESGRSLLCELREATTFPLIALSNADEGEEAVRRAIEHADYELVRPFSPSRFGAAVRAVVSRGRNLPRPREVEDEIVIGPLSLRRGRLDALVGDRRVELSPREFSLLYFLASSPGVVYTREELAQAAWGWQSTGDSRAVDNVVRRLRRKIESNPRVPRLLLTERGAGYRLMVP